MHTHTYTPTHSPPHTHTHTHTHLICHSDGGILDLPSEHNKVVDGTEKVHPHVIDFNKGVRHNHHLSLGAWDPHGLGRGEREGGEEREEGEEAMTVKDKLQLPILVSHIHM